MLRYFRDVKTKFFSYNGIMSLRPFKILAVWWPVFTIIAYGRYIYFPDRRVLGDSLAIWVFGRSMIVIISIFALIWRRKPIFRDLLGHAMLAYAAGAGFSYYLAVEVRDKTFWGEIIGLICVSMLIYSLCIASFLTIRAQEAEHILDASDEELEREL